MREGRPEKRLFQAPRGTRDVLPVEQDYWRYVEETAQRIAQLHGYRRIDTPAFEETPLFLRSVGEGTDIVEKEMYSFQDRGGVSLTLRPEGTAPVCRAYLEHGMHNLPQPVKLYYLASIFRYDRPQAGRYRQHEQFGWEALGSDAPALDAEVIQMSWELYQLLGLKGLTLQLNSIGCAQCRPAYVEELRRFYEGKARHLCRDCQSRLLRNPLRLLDCKRDQALAAAAPASFQHLCPDCASHFQHVQSYLHLLELPYNLDHRLVRGLDYYTRTVFEVQPADLGAQSTLGGGGRYDDLIQQLGGPPTPAIGFATGIQRIILNLKKQGVPIPPQEGPRVFLAYLGEEAQQLSLRLAAQLRREGIAVASAFGNRSLKAQLRQAHALGAPYAAIIGEDEVRAGTVTLRHMATGEQRSLTFEQAVKDIKGNH